MKTSFIRQRSLLPLLVLALALPILILFLVMPGHESRINAPMKTDISDSKFTSPEHSSSPSHTAELAQSQIAGSDHDLDTPARTFFADVDDPLEKQAARERLVMVRSRSISEFFH